MKTYEQFKKDWLWKWYAENKSLGFQCVAWVKIYAKEVLWVNLWKFSWSAYNWFVTCSPIIWLRFEKIFNTISFIPKQWDIIFFDKNKQNWMCGHVWIVDSADWKIVNVLNQNMFSGNGNNVKDWFSINSFDYINPKCLWVFRFKK